MRTQYNPNTEQTEFILTAEEMKDNEISIRVDERNKYIRETKAFIDKHSLEVGMKKGAREFAEWLCHSNLSRILISGFGQDDSIWHHDEIISIDDAISKYQKEIEK